MDLPELYQCVHCGLCLNQCPTYRALHLEPESPRGRIHLVRAAAEGRIELNQRFQDHLYLCLLCRACETACPSGVQYGRIAETAREIIGPPGSKLARAVLNFAFTQLLPYPRRLRVAAALLRLYQRCGLQRAIRPLLPERLRRMESMLPPISQRFFAPDAAVLPAIGARRAKVAMLNGCVMPLMFSDVNEATVRVSCDVTVAMSSFLQSKSVAARSTFTTAKARRRKRWHAATSIAFLDADVDAVVVNAAGCGAAMKEYGICCATIEAYAEKAKRFSSRVKDVTEFLASLGLVGKLAPLEMSVTVSGSLPSRARPARSQSAAELADDDSRTQAA